VIFAGQMGFYGYMFTDFGEAFKMMNTGKHLPVLLIDSITNEEEGRVIVNKEFKHDFKHGDFIRIDGVEGMKEVNGDARPVKIVDNYTFIIENTKNYGKYLKGGIAQKVKMTERIPFPNLKSQVIEPVFKEDANKHANELMMLATSAILSFF
jgi:ubiquitin-activating enzyme E1